ncbi:immunoglobulin superfamily member 5 [Colossoma macropomum]|uniref:immunoglobulin superfamily member 5 n=1 Tax=Colossoma macropomum TaxID=42526 RepID=UPI001863A405|nr:immunoglobulin superfamily member 5 [Colossoma macropomum]
MHGVLLLQLVLLACVMDVVLSAMRLEPRKATVLQGDEVCFNCSTDEPWDVMVWQLNGRSMLTISALHGPLGHSDSIWAVNHSTSAVSVWEFVLKSPEFRPTVQEVTCELLPDMVHRETAALSVQVEGRVLISGGNVSTQVGAPVVLQCQAVGWYPAPAVEWSINGATVDGSQFNSSSVQDQTGLFNITSVLQLRVENISRVECSVSIPALPAPHTCTVFISAVPQDSNSVVVIAVTATVCIIALLALITLIFFCRHKITKSKLFQDQLSFGQQNTENNYEEREGKVNFGYHPEGPTGFSNPPQADTETTAATQKVPDIIYIMSREPRQESVTDYVNVQRRDGVKKIRQTTTV